MTALAWDMRRMLNHVRLAMLTVKDQRLGLGPESMLVAYDMAKMVFTRAVQYELHLVR